MRKILIILLLIGMTLPANATVQWRNGTGSDTILGTENVSDIDSASFDNIVSPLDDLLSNYREGVALTYNAASQINATSGEIVVSNSDGSVRLMLKNTADTVVTWSDIDTGSEASSTTYYVYAIASAGSDTEATFKISTSSSAPTGVTYYKRLGSFYNDSNSNISDVDNDNIYEFGGWESKTVGTIYQALTDGIVTAYIGTTGGEQTQLYGYTDSSSTPTTQRIAWIWDTGNIYTGGIMFPVKKGDYYRVTQNDADSSTMYWIPLD